MSLYKTIESIKRSHAIRYSSTNIQTKNDIILNAKWRLGIALSIHYDDNLNWGFLEVYWIRHLVEVS